jgi:glycosyl transferase family 87
VLVAGGAAAAVAVALCAAELLTHPHVFTWFDLRVYTGAGRLVTRAPDALYRWQAQPGIRFTYTPFAALVFAAAAHLPGALLAGLMTAGSLAAAGLAGWLTLGALGWAGRRRAGAALAVTALALWTEPVQRTLRLGQVELLLMVLVVWDLCQPGRRRWQGVGIGVAAGIKLVPLIFIPYLLITRRVRQAAVATAAFAALVAAGFCALPGPSAQWWLGPDFLQAARTGFVGFVANQSLRGLASRELAGAPVSLWWWLAVAAAAGAAGLAAATVLHRHGRPVAGWLTCALTGLVVSPVSWDHHWVWIVPGLAWLVTLAARPARPGRARRGRWGRWLPVRCLQVRWLPVVALAGVFSAVPTLWAPRVSLVPWGLIWYAPCSPDGAAGGALASEYHWQGLTWLAGNSYLLAGLLSLAFLCGLAWTARFRLGARVAGHATAAAHGLVGLAEREVGEDAGRQDHDHDREHGGGVAPALAGGQQRAEAPLASHGHQQLTGQHAAPGERPRAPQGGQERRQRRGQDQMPPERGPAQAHGLARPPQHRRGGGAPAGEGAGGGRGGPERGHPHDRGGARPEQQDRERDPDHRGHGRQRGDRRARGGPQRRGPGGQHPGGHAGPGPGGEPERGLAEGGPRRLPQQRVVRHAPQAGDRRGGPGQDAFLPAGQAGRLPGACGQEQRQGLRPDAEP